MAAITINGNRLEPQHRAHSLSLQTDSDAPLSANDGEATNSNYILLQTRDKPLNADQKDLLGEKKVQIQEYVSTNTYLCRYQPVDLNPLRQHDFISYVAVYQPDLVVEHGLKTSDGSTADVTIALHGDMPSEELNRVPAQIAEAANIPSDQVKIVAGFARLTLPKYLLDRVAGLDAVKYINAAPEPRLLNNEARKILRVDEFHNPTAYKGKGQKVCVADTGFDKGSKVHCHPAFTGRVEKLYARGRATSTNDPDGHGTHVCGSVLGDGYSPLNSDINGGHIEAPASQATLLMQSVFDKFHPNPNAPDPYDPQAMIAGLGGLPDSYEDLFDEAYHDGARIHTNSWGSGPGRYGDAALAIDTYLWLRKEMVVLFAAGNEAIDVQLPFGKVDPGSIGKEASAKNCITVGASENVRPDLTFGGGRPLQYGRWARDFAYAPLSTDHVANNQDGLAAFSSRGPTMDHRYKPDVVAPGTCILSARSSRIIQGRYTEFWGVSYDDKWSYEGGTSMACPLVAGCCAIIRGCLDGNGVPTPSAALIKAILINGAVEMKGQFTPSEIGPAPNNDAGFGRVDIPRSLASIIPGPNELGGYSQGLELIERTNESHSFQIPVSGSTPKVLKVTLVWTDPAGAMLQSVLKLVVVDPSGTKEMHGNRPGAIFSGTNRRQEANFDLRNNVQQVLWQITQPGDYTVTIEVHQLTQVTKQPFSYAWHLYEQNSV